MQKISKHFENVTDSLNFLTTKIFEQICFSLKIEGNKSEDALVQWISVTRSRILFHYLKFEFLNSSMRSYSQTVSWYVIFWQLTWQKACTKGQLSNCKTNVTNFRIIAWFYTVKNNLKIKVWLWVFDFSSKVQ